MNSFHAVSKSTTLVHNSQSCSQAFLPSSFWLLAICKEWGEGLVPFYHVRDVSVYLGDRGWVGWGRGLPLKERISCTCSSFWMKESTFFSLWEHLKLNCLGQKLLRYGFKLVLSMATIYLDKYWRHSHVIDKMDQAFPLHCCILQVIKNLTMGRPGGTRLQNSPIVPVFLTMSSLKSLGLDRFHVWERWKCGDDSRDPGQADTSLHRTCTLWKYLGVIVVRRNDRLYWLQ